MKIKKRNLLNHEDDLTAHLFVWGFFKKISQLYFPVYTEELFIPFIKLISNYNFYAVINNIFKTHFFK